MNNPIRTTEYLQTNTGEKFYPKTIDSQVEISIDGKNGTVKDELISINNKFGGYTTTAELPKTYTPTEELEKNYLKISDAANTYSTINQLNTVDQKFNNYTETTVLENTYATIEELNNTNNKFNSYTLTENLQADYLSKNDAADTYLTISALDETVANSVSDYVNSEEMKSLLVTKDEFNQYGNEVSNSFEDIDSNITTIENDISNLKTEDSDINDKISYINTNRSMQELRHSYNASSKTHTLNFILSNGILGRDIEPSQYKHFFFTSTASWIPGDKLHINLIDLDLIPMNIYGEDITGEDIFGKNVIVHFSISGNKCFFKSGGTNDLNCKIIGGSTYPSLSSNLLYNSYNNDIVGATKDSNGRLSFTEEYDTQNNIVLPIYLENNKTYCIQGYSDGQPVSLGGLRITAKIERADGTVVKVADQRIESFTWTYPTELAHYNISVATTDSENLKGLTFLPYVIEGDGSNVNIEPYKQKENTIWIKTDNDTPALTEVDGSSTRGSYINTSGKVTTAASGDTCITTCFISKERNIYNFKLNDYKTFIVAAFLEKPVVGSIGDILFNSSNDEILEENETLGVNIMAPVGYKYIAVYYYHIDKNENIPSLTVTNVTSKTDLDKNSYIFKQNQPYYNFISDSNIIEKSYIGDDGRIKTQTNALAPSYTKNYIPVKYGEKYSIEYTTSEKKQLWFGICEYNASKSIIGTRDERISISESETSESKLQDRFEDIYTPSSEKVAFVRLTWRTFSPSGVASNVFFGYNDNLIANKSNTVYFKTTYDTENSKEFNFSKKNSVIMNLEKAYICNNEDWVEKDFYIYKNEKWI